MTKTSGTVVFFGNERLATGVTTSAPILRALIDANYSIACVITNYPYIQTRNRRELEIIEVANQHNIPVCLPNKLKDVKHHLEMSGAPTGILAAYGKIVPKEVIDLFPNGIINIHPSLLPKHRGPIPIESVILNGEAATGVSLMMLTNQLDAGPILAQTKITLGTKETKQNLANALNQLGADMLVQHLPNVMDGNSVTRTPQNDSEATYDGLIEKNDGLIDWQKPAIQIEREIRAYLGWPNSSCELHNKKLIITEAIALGEELSQENEAGTPVKLSRNSFGIQTAQGVLKIEKLKPEGKPEMTAQAFLAGYGQSF